MKNPQTIEYFKEAVQTVESWGFTEWDFESKLDMVYTTAKSYTDAGSSGYIYCYRNGNEFKLRISDHGCGLNRLTSEYHTLDALHLALFPDEYEEVVNRVYSTVEIECAEHELPIYEGRNMNILSERLSAKGNRVFRITFMRYTDTIEHIKK